MENKEPKKFNCWNCGVCCKMCNLLDELKHFDSGNGVCINLNDDNTCAIYDTRPDVCNTKTMYNAKYKDKLSWDEYVTVSESVCKWLEKTLGIDKDYNSKKSEKKQ